MASKAVEDAVESYLTVNWTNCPVLTENRDAETPADGSPFIMLEFPLSDVRRLTVGDRNYRETGGFRIVIAVERGTGTQTIRQWGAQLAALFRDRKLGEVNCRIPTEVFTDETSDEGNYFRGSMICEYDYGFNG